MQENAKTDQLELMYRKLWSASKIHSKESKDRILSTDTGNSSKRLKNLIENRTLISLLESSWFFELLIRRYDGFSADFLIWKYSGESWFSGATRQAGIANASALLFIKYSESEEASEVPVSGSRSIAETLNKSFQDVPFFLVLITCLRDDIRDLVKENDWTDVCKWWLKSGIHEYTRLVPILQEATINKVITIACGIHGSDSDGDYTRFFNSDEGILSIEDYVAGVKSTIEYRAGKILGVFAVDGGGENCLKARIFDALCYAVSSSLYKQTDFSESDWVGGWEELFNSDKKVINDLVLQISFILENHPKRKELLRSFRTSSVREVNLYGLGNYVLGIGEDARCVRSALEQAGISVNVCDPGLKVNAARFDKETRYSPHKEGVLTLVVLPPMEAVRFLFDMKINICKGAPLVNYGVCEADRLAQDIVKFMEIFDEYWCPSSFVESVFRFSWGEKVQKVPYSITPLVMSKGNGADQKNFKSGRLVTIFDSNSTITRKNPDLVIESFLEAFPEDIFPKLELLVKTMNLDETSGNAQILKNLARRDGRISIVNECFSFSALSKLITDSVGLISLHRSEGFGRLLAEAICAGIPVVSSNYSGSKDFASYDPSLLVDGRMVRVGETAYPWSEGSMWFEPDKISAVKAMKYLASNYEKIKLETTLQGRKVSQFYSTAEFANRIKNVLCI